MTESENKNHIQRVARSFPFALRSPDAILRSLTDQNGYLPIIEVYLGHKSEDSKFSANMLAPIGGKILPGETDIQAAYRTVMAETALACSPIIEREESHMSVEGSFTFDILGSKDPGRAASFSLVPVISPQIVTGIFPIQEDSKVDRLIGMTISEFKDATDVGYYDGPNGKFKLQGHITKLVKPTDIRIDQNETIQRDKMIDLITYRLKLQEIKTTSKLYKKLKYFAEGTGKANDVFPDFNDLSEDELLIAEASNLKKVMSELQLKLGLLFNPIFKKAYSTVIGEYYMDYFRKKEDILEHNQTEASNKIDRLKSKAEMIKKRFLDTNFGVDILHFLPLFINQKDTIKGKTTRLVTNLSQFLRDVFRMSTPFEERRVDESLRDYEDRRFVYFQDYFLNPSFNLDNKKNKIEQIDNNIVRLIAEIFGYSEEHVKNSWIKCARFIPDISNEAKMAAPEWQALYQINERRNEITNASLGQALLLSFGIDIKSHSPKQMSLIQFESFLQMTLFLKELFIAPKYDEIVKAKPHPVDLAISDFFGSVQEEFMMKFGKGENAKEMRVTYRKGNKSRLVLVDEKPTKSKTSVIRKSFEEKVEDIVDVSSCSIVLPDDAYRNHNFSKRMHMVNEQAEEFIEYLVRNYPNWQVNKIEDKDTFPNYFDAMAGKDFSDGGKRTGSKGDLLIRRKIKIQMIDPNGKNYFYEMVFYPYMSFSGEDQEKERSLGLMAWKEKIEDDPDYALKRILFPLRGALGLHSLYELFNPPSVYPNLINSVRSKSVRVFRHS